MNKISNKVIINDVLCAAAAVEKNLIVLCSDSRGSASLEPFAKKIKGKPTVIIAHTVKGCGVSFMENQLVWHHRIPSDKEYLAALKELEERSARCE